MEDISCRRGVPSNGIVSPLAILCGIVECDERDKRYGVVLLLGREVWESIGRRIGPGLFDVRTGAFLSRINKWPGAVPARAVRERPKPNEPIVCLHQRVRCRTVRGRVRGNDRIQCVSEPLPRGEVWERE